MSDIVSSLVANLPKAELHVHLEGTLEPEMMLEKAGKNGIRLPYRGIEDVKKAYKFKDLQSFLDLYYLGVSSLVDEQDFFDLAYAYFRRAASQNVKRAEAFFDPQAHTRRGVDFSTVIKGIHRAALKAQEELGVSVGLIMCFLRDMPEESAVETLEAASQYRDWIIGVGLDSKELGNPPSKFKRAFKMAEDLGLHKVAHAGEEAPASYIWEAIRELGVERIDHGYHIFEDPALVEHVKETKLPLTMCPLAAVGVEYFKDLREVPVKRALEEGIIVSINSDDPAYFGGYINENYLAVARAQGLTEEELRRIAANSFISSFMPNAEKERLASLADQGDL